MTRRPLEPRQLGSQLSDLLALGLHRRHKHARVAVEVDHVALGVHRRASRNVFDDEPEMALSGQRRVAVHVGRQLEALKLASDARAFGLVEIDDLLLRPPCGDWTGATVRRVPRALLA